MKPFYFHTPTDNPVTLSLASSRKLTRVSLPLFLLPLTLVGCGEQFIRGGGSRSVRAGDTQTKAVYCIGAEKKLEFLIVTDLPNTGTTASSGSTWEGAIVPEQGIAVRYKGTTEGVTINGANYDFGKGRVLLVSTENDRATVRQVPVPMSDADYKAEIDRIVQLDEVQEFVKASAEDEE